MEIWRDIKGFKGLYQISNKGRVKSIERYSIQKHLIAEKFLHIAHSQSGYCDVSLYIDGKRYHRKIHRLVAETFIPNPNNLPEVDHIDTNKDNNCVENLRWCTHQENHLNPLTVKLKSEIMMGRKPSEEALNKMRIKIKVYKDDKFICEFNSYKDMDLHSKDIFGFTIWNVYVRKVINGEMNNYHGYTFEEVRYKPIKSQAKGSHK
jgi:hypothetical protein